jgi:class 3 adenylate cyclase
VNKLIGDGVLAVFGAPNSYLENQQNAVQCALDMMEALKKVNIMYQDVLGEEIKIGIGINTGEVVVGNIGTIDYLEYTVIGDAVNVASRIETMTKRKPNSILISESTLVEVDGTFDTQEVESLEMSGKKEPVRVYEVLGKRAAKIQPIGRTGTHRGY